MGGMEGKEGRSPPYVFVKVGAYVDGQIPITAL